MRQAASYLQGALIPAWYSPVYGDAPNREFLEAWSKAHGQALLPETFEAFGYDSVDWLRGLLIDEGLHTRPAVRGALASGRRFSGATGQVAFSADGEPRRTLRFVSVDGERFVPTSFTVATPVGGGALDAPPPEEEGGAAGDQGPPP